MASFGLGKAFRSAWHSLTSYDRHSDFDSPYRTGRHVPLAQSRHDALTSVATDGSESRADVSSPYFEEHGRNSLTANTSHGYPQSPAFPASPGNTSPSPYSPGMRSSQHAARKNDFSENSGEIQMSAFQDGLPPPPPISHSWKRIDAWAEEHYEELFEELGEGCTNNDLNDLEHQLDCSLPMEVRESLQIHDGQERGGRPTGIIFGCMLLDCEEIVQEWQNWKVVNEQYLTSPVTSRPTAPQQTLGGASSSSANKQPQQNNGQWRQELMNKQDSQPSGAIQKVYAHPAWIPLARDWGGNNLAVDLAPGPTGKWGQVILFGRDYDCKYVVARSWSAFMATVADDMNSGKWFIDEESHELKLREFKNPKVEPGYLDILRWRADQKYGRKNQGQNGNRRRSQGGPGSHRGTASPTASPYGSPAAEIGEPRGRSMQRFAGASPVASPARAGFAQKSPLSKVAEEVPAVAKPTPLKTSMESSNGKLVEVATPRPSSEKKDEKKEEKEEDLEDLLDPISLEDKEDKSIKVEDKKANGSVGGDKKAEEDQMKTIEI